MARRVTLATISARPCRLGPGVAMEAAVPKVLEYLRERIAQVLPDRPDLIVLPETCDCPEEFASEWEGLRDYSRVRGTRLLEPLCALAREQRCLLAYPHVRNLPDGSFRNAVCLIDRQGAILGWYHKNHLVIEERTRMGTLYGRRAPLFDCEFGRVACAICFDLNFDELRRQYVRARPDLILFCSAFHGGIAQALWAYTCRAHLVAAIGGGPPGAILSPQGEVLAETTNYTDWAVARVNLDGCLVHLDYHGDKLAALKRRYGPGVAIRDPGRLGTVRVTSETEGLSVAAMLREFEIEPFDDYLERARRHRAAPGSLER